MRLTEVIMRTGSDGKVQPMIPIDETSTTGLGANVSFSCLVWIWQLVFLNTLARHWQHQPHTHTNWIDKRCCSIIFRVYRLILGNVSSLSWPTSASACGHWTQPPLHQSWLSKLEALSRCTSFNHKSIHFDKLSAGRTGADYTPLSDPPDPILLVSRPPVLVF